MVRKKQIFSKEKRVESSREKSGYDGFQAPDKSGNDGFQAPDKSGTDTQTQTMKFFEKNDSDIEDETIKILNLDDDEILDYSYIQSSSQINNSTIRKIKQRKKMNIEQKESETQKNRERMALNRKIFVEKSHVEKQKNRERIALKRKIFEESQVEKQKNRERIALKRRIFVEESQVEKQKNRERMALKRKKELNGKVESYICASSLNVTKHKLGPMNKECVHCHSLNFSEEIVAGKKSEFKNCCHYGKVFLSHFPEKNFPVGLKNLFIRNDVKSRMFFENIRYLNSTLSMASINPIRYKFKHNRGPYCFRISGQIFHKMNIALLPDEKEEPTNGQLFIVDTGDAVNLMKQSNPKIDNDLLNYLFNLIKSENPFAKAFVMMKEEEDAEKERAKKEGREPIEMKLLFGLAPNMDKNRYKLPRANEVAVVFVPGADGEIPESKIVVRERGKELKILNSIDKNVTPLCYPLFFPRGIPGWHPEMKQTNGYKSLTRLQYASYCMAVKNEFNPLLFGGKLFQQWCVDEYVKIENDRLQWIRNNQKKILADSYKNVDSFLLKKVQETGLPIGRKIILPSTIVGSPRYIEKHFQDAMTIVRRFGKPDLFITMTCNPKWEEIQENLYNEQDPSDRPDIIDRVFNLKVKALLRDVTNQVFGLCIAWMYPVEFQLRGLPHIHLLITLAEKDKLHDGEDVDKRGISAKIPNKNEDPELYNLVKKHMIHGPCGILNPNSPCMEESFDKNNVKIKRCSKGYPKAFQEKTIVLENGFTIYARPNDGNFVEIKTFDGKIHKLDNRWVVPHMPYLLKKFSCHINVEKVNSLSSVKYLHKYIHKGPDRTGVKLVEKIDFDEVKQFTDARFVSPTDAVWRILEFPICDRSHAIKVLPVHLSGEQVYYFDENMEEEELRDRINRNTELMAYFELNKTDELAKNKYYHEIPEFFVFGNGKWKRRVGIENNKTENFQTKTIGRLVKVLPSETERYYLRLLLLHVKGATSFEDIKTINNICYPTYAEACLALGLIRDDEEWKKAIEEANFYMMPPKLRMFYALILAHCGPSKPRELWELFSESLSEDFLKNYNKETAKKLAYREIVRNLKETGKSISEFPTMPQISEEINDEEFDQEKEMNKGKKLYLLMNDGQKSIIDEIMKKIDNPDNSGGFYFIDGPGGVGKTFINKTLCHLIKGRGKKYSTMAFTGIAANLLPNGRTLHNRFGLNLDLTNSNIGPKSIGWKELKETDLFIIDEAPMIDKKALETIDKKLKEIMQNDLLFGGKVMVWTGDFRQTLPIKNYATKAQIIDSIIKRSEYWNYVKKLELHKNMRALPTEQEFAKNLIDIGDGKLNNEKNEIIVPSECVSNGNLVEEIFGQIVSSKNWDELSKVAILAPKNIDVNEMNKNVLDMLPGEEKVYTSIDNAENEQKQRLDEYLDEYLHSLNPQGLPQHELRLKENSVIMLLRNLNICRGLCNGTRLSVMSMKDHVLVCKIIEEFCEECENSHQNKIVFIPRITLSCENEYPFSLIRHQFPVKLAFAMSINKAQGQTLEKCGLDLRKDVFSHGQLYVALSRVRTWKSLKIKLMDQENTRKVKNIVYKEVFD